VCGCGVLRAEALCFAEGVMAKAVVE
jgi:hypothetical protein